MPKCTLTDLLYDINSIFGMKHTNNLHKYSRYVPPSARKVGRGDVGPTVPSFKYFSIFNMLSDNEVNFDNKPSLLMLKSPNQNSLVCSIDEHKTDDVIAAINMVNFLSTAFLTFSENCDYAIVSFQSADVMAAFITSSFAIKDTPTQFRRIVQFKSSFVIVILKELDPAPFATMARDIDAALKPFGEVQDIVFSINGRVLVPDTWVLFDCAEYGRLPGHIKIGAKDIPFLTLAIGLNKNGDIISA